MVKELIKGILGKKNKEKKEESPEEDVPDELPSLLDEEETNEESDKKEEKGDDNHFDTLLESDSEESKEENSDDTKKKETNNVDANGLKEEKGEEIKDAEQENEELPSLLKNTDKQETSGENEDSTEGDKTENNVDKAHATDKEKGFFAGIKLLTDEQGIKENVLNQDLLKKMKDFWYFHPGDKWRFGSKEKLKQDIKDEIEQLKRLEERWISQKKFIEEDKRILLEKERDIKVKADKLKKLLSQLRLYKEVDSDKYFKLENGVIVKSVYELLNFMEIMDVKSFRHHATDTRNDFSDWIMVAIQDHSLAKKIRGAQTKEEMAVILENALEGKLHGIEPNEYFRMCNNTIVRDIKELINALKGANDAIFRTHVNDEKNDLSSWIRHVFKNDYLADKMLDTQSKDETIKILERFYHI